MARERGRRRGLKWLTGLVIILALLWCGVWYAAGRAAQAGVDRLTAAVSARGGSLSFDEQGIGGFPLSLDFNGSGLKVAYAPASLAAGLNRLTAQAPLYYPGRVTAEFVSPLVLNIPGNGIAVSASWSIATASADAGLNGLSRAGGSIDGLALDQTGPRLPIRRIEARHADFAAGPGAGDGYRITATANDVSLQRTDGQTYPMLAGEVDLTALHFGSSLGTDPKRAIAAWAATGGAMRVDRLSIAAGTFSVAASGDLTLGRDGLLSGKLMLVLTGLADLPDLAEQLKPGTHDRVAKVVTAVTGLTQPTGKGDTRQVPLILNKGIVSIGFIPIAVIPPVKFQS